MNREAYPTKFSPVVPPGALEQLLFSASIDTSYLLLLAHDVVENRDMWEELRFRHLLDEPFIILDNSVVELGDAVDFDLMYEACEIVHPDVVVLPDVMGNAQATVERSTKAAVEWRDLRCEHFMAVIQGITLPEFKQCSYELTRLPRVSWLSVPKHIGETRGSREPFVQALTEIITTNAGFSTGPIPNFNVHLLGFSNNFWDDLVCCSYPLVKGIDSAVPARLGINHIQMSKDPLVEAGPRGNFWEQAFDGLNHQAKENIRWVQRMLTSDNQLSIAALRYLAQNQQTLG